MNFLALKKKGDVWRHFLVGELLDDENCDGKDRYEIDPAGRSGRGGGGGGGSVEGLPDQVLVAAGEADEAVIVVVVVNPCERAGLLPWDSEGN